MIFYLSLIKRNSLLILQKCYKNSTFKTKFAIKVLYYINIALFIIITVIIYAC